MPKMQYARVQFKHFSATIVRDKPVPGRSPQRIMDERVRREKKQGLVPARRRDLPDRIARLGFDRDIDLYPADQQGMRLR